MPRRWATTTIIIWWNTPVWCHPGNGRFCCLVLWRSSGICDTRWFCYCDTSECRWDLDSLEQSFRHPHCSTVPDAILECTSDHSAIRFTDCFTIRFTHYDGTHSQRSDPCSSFHRADHRSIGSTPSRTFHKQRTFCPCTGSLCNRLSIYRGAHMPNVHKTIKCPLVRELFHNFSHNRGNKTTTTTISTLCETVSNYGGQRQCGYCQQMTGNGPIATMNGHAGLTKNSFTSHTIDNCNGIKGNAMSHVWHTTT